MTSIIKIGGKSCETGEQMGRLTQAFEEWDGNIVAVVSAQGRTTDRIEDAIKEAREGKALQPKQIFGEFENAYNWLNDKNLSGLRDAAYSDFERIKTEKLEDPSYTAFLHLYGERLSAAAFSSFLGASGIHSKWLDFTDSEFPLAVKGDHHAARIDFSASRKKASSINGQEKVVVLPGYGGVDKKQLKTLGRGGSDTAAFGCLYAFGGKDLWILTNVNGILEIDGKGKTVGEIDVQEAMDAAALGAKLPGSRSLEGAAKCFSEGAYPDIYVANSRDISRHTKIVYRTKDTTPVKLVAGRDVIAYEMKGDIRGVQKAFDQTGVEFNLCCSPFYGSLLVPSDASGQADKILDRLFGERLKNGYVKIEKAGVYSWIGAVGKGMEEARGITARAGYALSSAGIDIIYNRDPGKVSVGFVIDAENRKKALAALHEEFLAAN